MKTDDFFEALTDIDDKFIEDAKQPAQKPVEMRMDRRAPWKTAAAAAACLAIVGSLAAVVAVNANRGGLSANPEKDVELTPANVMSNSMSTGAASYSVYDTYDAVIDGITFNGQEFKVVNSEDIDGVKFSVGLSQDIYGMGAYVEALAVVQNTTDKPVGLWRPVTGEGSHTEVSFSVSKDSFALTDPDVIGLGFDQAESLYIIQPGETYYQETRFTTMMENPVDAVCVPGKYKGKAAVTLHDPYDETVEIRGCTLGFEVNIADWAACTDYFRNHDGIDIQDDFKLWSDPDTTFQYTRTAIYEYDGESGKTMLFGGVVWDYYLYDLNGDGSPEIISTRSGEARVYDHDPTGSFEYADKEIAVYDHNNKKMYRLWDDDYDLVMNCINGRPVVFKFGKDGSKISYEPLTLEKAVEVDELPMGSMEQTDNPVVTTIADRFYEDGEWEEVNFTMDEFPGAAFRLTKDSEDLYVTVGGEEIKLYGGMPIWNVFLTDLNGDGKREICSTVSEGSGIIDYRISVYDFACRDYEYGLYYTHSDRGKTDYVLRVDFDVLMIYGYNFDASSGPSEENLRGSKPLTMDMVHTMEQYEGWKAPASPVSWVPPDNENEQYTLVPADKEYLLPANPTGGSSAVYEVHNDDRICDWWYLYVTGENSPVYATASGVVVLSFSDAGSDHGMFVIYCENDKKYYTYWTVKPYVTEDGKTVVYSKGDHVVAGQQIGCTLNSGEGMNGSSCVVVMRTDVAPVKVYD